MARRRRHASLALAALVVLARLVSSGGTATASISSEESIRADLSHHRSPSRTLRSHHGVHARLVARDSTLDACLAAVPLVVEEPPRLLVPPVVLPLATPVVALPLRAAQARAPPR